MRFSSLYCFELLLVSSKGKELSETKQKSVDRTITLFMYLVKSLLMMNQRIKLLLLLLLLYSDGYPPLLLLLLLL